LPAGFSDARVFAVGGPTAIAFTPDQRMLVSTQSGTLRVFQNDTLLPAPALSFPATRICTNSERGLLGLAVDPDFARNQFIYLYYTFRRPNGDCGSRSLNGPVNRVSRFVLPANNVVDPNTETVLLDNISSWNGNHNAGDLQFGKDGLLYVAVGDAGCDPYGTGCAGSNDAARDVHTPLGKILRIDRDGNVPVTNPWRGDNTARCNNGIAPAGVRCQETYSWGLRNPFRMAMDPNADQTRLFINDVGQDRWEEIDVAAPGADFGWNVREGFCRNGSSTECAPANPAPAGMADPLFAYPHDTQVPGTESRNCNSISGGAFVPRGVWPAEWDGVYLFSDYVCGSIFAIDSFAARPGARDFVRGLGGSSAVHLTFGPFQQSQALYYTTYAGGGQVRRISYTGPGNNRPPVAVFTASPTSGAIPLSVTFSGAGSSDPDAGDTLSYFWDFGDGATRTTSTPSTSYVYTRAGEFTASLRVRDQNLAFSLPVTVRIFAGNSAPVARMDTPAAEARFAVGQTITLSATATDAEDGVLPPAALSWTVILHHDQHTHPFLGPLTGNNLTFSAPAPEDLLAATNSYLEIRLVVRDSTGEQVVVTRDLRPQAVNLTFQTNPPGLSLRVNEETLAAPRTLVSWANWVLDVTAPDQTNTAGQRFVFDSWSNGGTRSQRLATPSAPATYTATFRPTGSATDTGAAASAASYSRDALAPGSIGSFFGPRLASATTVAPSTPLPTALDGLSIVIRDSSAVERNAPLYFASPGQVNFVVPAATATGPAVVSAVRNREVIASSAITIESAAPGIFTANGDGRGVPAALYQRGTQILNVFQCGPVAGSCVPAVIDLADSGETILSLYGTGWRGRTGSVRAQANGIELPVQFAGPQGQFDGLDQLNVVLPSSLRGRGELMVLVSAEGKASNPVRINVR
jgi:uncharacterized protein (TIGR03437 family)